MKIRFLGILLLILSIILLVVIISYTSSIMRSSKVACECGDTQECPHEKNLPLQSYIGISIVIILFILSYLLIKSKDIIKKEIKKDINKLNDEEKKIYDVIENNEGTIFQSELIEKSGFSKVKISRVLDKLESKGFIEKRRKGMSNLIISK